MYPLVRPRSNSTATQPAVGRASFAESHVLPTPAELSRLRGQMQPHFLFNALHAVSALVRLQQNEQAVRALSHLGELHRHLLEHTDTPFVPLSREIAFIEHYLGFERLRFGGRLQADLEIEPGAENAVVPNLLLQPLVENAIKHGVALREGAGRVTLYATRAAGRLHVILRNDPATAPGEKPAGMGFGLRAVQRRLTGIYGDEARFAFIPTHPEGVTVTLEIPV